MNYQICRSENVNNIESLMLIACLIFRLMSLYFIWTLRVYGKNILEHPKGNYTYRQFVACPLCNLICFNWKIPHGIRTGHILAWQIEFPPLKGCNQKEESGKYTSTRWMIRDDIIPYVMNKKWSSTVLRWSIRITCVTLYCITTIWTKMPTIGSIIVTRNSQYFIHSKVLEMTYLIHDFTGRVSLQRTSNTEITSMTILPMIYCNTLLNWGITQCFLSKGLTPHWQHHRPLYPC